MEKKNPKKKRYKSIGGKHLIEVRVKEAQQLFDFRDPSPFREKDLDDDFFEYIESAAMEFSHKTPLKIVIYIGTKQTNELPKDSILDGIHSFLTYKIELAQIALHSFFRRSQMFFLFGVGTLIICLGLAHNIPLNQQSGAMVLLREGLIIFGWVSIWKPIELLMFEWYPLFEKLRLLRKLLETEVNVEFDN